MRVNPMPFPEHSFVGSCVRLAQATFFDTLPANAEHRRPSAPADLPAGKLAAVVPGGGPRWITWLDNWFHAQGMKEREAYLAQSRDVFELENRIRHLERRPYY